MLRLGLPQQFISCCWLDVHAHARRWPCMGLVAEQLVTWPLCLAVLFGRLQGCCLLSCRVSVCLQLSTAFRDLWFETLNPVHLAHLPPAVCTRRRAQPAFVPSLHAASLCCHHCALSGKLL